MADSENFKKVGNRMPAGPRLLWDNRNSTRWNSSFYTVFWELYNFINCAHHPRAEYPCAPVPSGAAENTCDSGDTPGRAYVVENFYYNVTPRAPPKREYDEATRTQAPRINHLLPRLQCQVSRPTRWGRVGQQELKNSVP